jgi:hypothetical protein
METKYTPVTNSPSSSIEPLASLGSPSPQEATGGELTAAAVIDVLIPDYAAS